MIYFVHDLGSGAIKIGTTVGGVSQRLAELQTGCPTRLRLVATMPGDRPVEQMLHRRFRRVRRRGEWFVPTGELLQFIVTEAVLQPEEFGVLVEIEPRLGMIWQAAMALHADPDPNFCANVAWYGCYGRRGLKADLLSLVGWEARRQSLRSSHVYDVAYDALYGTLPDCRQCACTNCLALPEHR